ncbi:glycosyltransferase family 8 protein [Paramixta manurensis]|uniref:Glycosyltransferase family 8 protein n=1 Tax=Paramixta manurensis TaxID=2740817 RepID=A0A6M8UAA7_9GAMM|nr:glycosyltransferase family 8 protein [Erwiniaceae bacterium PD-1]
MKAWVTLLTKANYLPGVETLHASLQASGTRWPLVVMVTEEIAPAECQRLREQGCLIRAVMPLNPGNQSAEHYVAERFTDVWTKLRSWELTEFERVVFLDADMLVMQNMDELLEMPLPEQGIAACHACRCNPNHIANYPRSWTPENCAYSWQERNQPTPDRLDNYLNSGLLVLTPDEQVFQQLEAAIAAITDLSAYPFPEQDLLNEFFAKRWTPLPWIYNALKTLAFQHPKLWRLEEAKNIHYILDKPWTRDWRQPENERDNYYALDSLWRERAPASALADASGSGSD